MPPTDDDIRAALAQALMGIPSMREEALDRNPDRGEARDIAGIVRGLSRRAAFARFVRTMGVRPGTLALAVVG